MFYRFACFFMLGIPAASAGILVDHPTGAVPVDYPTIRLALVQDDAVTRAAATVSGVELQDCDGNTQWIEVNTAVDLVGGDSLPVLTGTWCGIAAHVPEGVDLEVRAEDGSTGTVHLGATRFVFLAPGEDPVTIGSGAVSMEVATPWTFDAARAQRLLDPAEAEAEAEAAAVAEEVELGGTVVP